MFSSSKKLVFVNGEFENGGKITEHFFLSFSHLFIF